MVYLRFLNWISLQFKWQLRVRPGNIRNIGFNKYCVLFSYASLTKTQNWFPMSLKLHECLRGCDGLHFELRLVETIGFKIFRFSPKLSFSAYKCISCKFWWHIFHLEPPILRLELRKETFNADLRNDYSHFGQTLEKFGQNGVYLYNILNTISYICSGLTSFISCCWDVLGSKQQHQQQRLFSHINITDIFLNTFFG